MDFDAQLDRILLLLERDIYKLAAEGNSDFHKPNSEALAAIKQLIESKQPEKRGAHNTDSGFAVNDEAFNAGINAWREGMGL